MHEQKQRKKRVSGVYEIGAGRARNDTREGGTGRFDSGAAHHEKLAPEAAEMCLVIAVDLTDHDTR